MKKKKQKASAYKLMNNLKIMDREIVYLNKISISHRLSVSGKDQIPSVMRAP